MSATREAWAHPEILAYTCLYWCVLQVVSWHSQNPAVFCYNAMVYTSTAMYSGLSRQFEKSSGSVHVTVCIYWSQYILSSKSYIGMYQDILVRNFQIDSWKVALYDIIYDIISHWYCLRYDMFWNSMMSYTHNIICIWYHTFAQWYHIKAVYDIND
jgi:hypothetical protein